MSTKTTRPDKRTDDGPIRRERSYHAVPADWIRLGRDHLVLEDRDRFVAEHVCYEYTLERDAHAVGGVAERHELYVLYRKPGTDETVQRQFAASVTETSADALRVPTSERDGDIGPDNWGTIPYRALKPAENVAVVPRVVRDGEPLNFAASVAVHRDERRIGEDR